MDHFYLEAINYVTAILAPRFAARHYYPNS